MSTDSESPPLKAMRPIQRLGTGALSILQVVCFTLLFLGVNYLSSQHYVPKDLSSDAAFTLSPATTRYLESPAVQERADPIRLLIAFKRNNGLYDRVRALGEEYMRVSRGKVRLELLDPVRSPDRTQQVAKEYGKTFSTAYGKSMFTTDLAIVDARTAAEKQAQESGKEPAGSPHVQFIEAESMARFEIDAQEKRKITGFTGEDAITTGLVAAIEGRPRQVYFLADKCGYSADAADSPVMNFEGTMLTQNALTKRVRLADFERIPDDASAVAIINPVYDFTPGELEVLAEYWARPKAAILVTLGAAETPARLRAFLRNLGITPGRDRVITKKGNQVVTNVRATFIAGLDFNRDFWDKTTTFEGSTCSLDIRENDNEDLLTHQVQTFMLLATGPEFWGETAFSTANPTFDLRSDKPGPIRVAGAVIRGAATRDDIGDQISRMVVIGNSDFLSPKYFSDINKDFLASSMNWMIGREELTGSGPRTLGTYKLPLLDSQVSFINRINLFFLPAFALVICAIVWSSRRA